MGFGKAGEWVCIGHLSLMGPWNYLIVYRTIRYMGLRSEETTCGQEV